MSTFDLVITGGTVVSDRDRARAEIGIRDGAIAAIALSRQPVSSNRRGRIMIVRLVSRISRLRRLGVGIR